MHTCIHTCMYAHTELGTYASTYTPTCIHVYMHSELPSGAVPAGRLGEEGPASGGGYGLIQQWVGLDEGQGLIGELTGAAVGACSPGASTRAWPGRREHPAMGIAAWHSLPSPMHPTAPHPRGPVRQGDNARSPHPKTTPPSLPSAPEAGKEQPDPSRPTGEGEPGIPAPCPYQLAAPKPVPGLGHLVFRDRRPGSIWAPLLLEPPSEHTLDVIQVEGTDSRAGDAGEMGRCEHGAQLGPPAWVQELAGHGASGLSQVPEGPRPLVGCIASCLRGCWDISGRTGRRDTCHGTCWPEW